MRLFVTHRTEYRFSQPPSRLVQLLRMRPGNHAGQSVVSWSLDVDRDLRLKPGRDGYGNETAMLYVDGPLDSVAITVSGEVLTEDRAGMVDGAVESLSPLAFLQPTGLTAADAAIRDHVDGLQPGSSGRLAGAHMLAESLHDLFGFTEPHGDGDHAAAAVFASRTADPRGAAHVLIAAARHAGFPARYVAGHVYRPDSPDLHGAHGWAELHVDGYGWIGFDVHAGHCPTDRYVRVAIGLDYREAAPVSGARIGGGLELLAVGGHVGPERVRQD